MYGYTILGNLLCENRQKRIFRELSDRFWGNFCPESEGNGTDPAPEILQKKDGLPKQSILFKRQGQS